MSDTISGRKKIAYELFTRYEGNPILTPDDWPYPANAVMNPGAIMVHGEVLLLVRVEDMHGISHLTVARSADGLTDWRIAPEPSMANDSPSCEEWGLADPRLMFAEEQNQFFITYISLSESGSRVNLAITKNFKTFARLGCLLGPDAKDGSLFPCRFNGRFSLIHCSTILGKSNIWISCSPDLKHWGDSKILLATRPDSWDCHKVGLACQPIKTKQGWLMFYHGVETTTDCNIYRVGLALLDLNEPWRVLRRSNDWILEPSESYEYTSDVGKIIFPTGIIVHENRINLYYGAADRCVAVASAKLDDVMNYVMSCPKVS